MEDDLKKKENKEDDLKKMEDEPINQNQPNWVKHTALATEIETLVDSPK
jgi:hypothetical protein